MKVMILRSVYAMVAAVVVAGGMLMTAKPATAAPAGCYLITHFSDSGSQDIVVNANSWKGHAKHGDIWLADAPCEDETTPV
jgi:hypothetical protein